MKQDSPHVGNRKYETRKSSYGKPQEAYCPRRNQFWEWGYPSPIRRIPKSQRGAGRTCDRTAVPPRKGHGTRYTPLPNVNRQTPVKT